MKIGILFDAMSALGPLPDGLILESVEAVEGAIGAWSKSHVAVRVPVNPDGRWVERVRRAKFDLVFNLCEGIDGVAEFEPMVISVLELFGIPHSGNSSATTALCLHKNVVNTLLDSAGLIEEDGSGTRPTPDGIAAFAAFALCAPHDALMQDFTTSSFPTTTAHAATAPRRSVLDARARSRKSSSRAPYNPSRQLPPFARVLP